ncbi:MAG: Hsp20/alpha crystallin family protein [Proteobacteria bacterium]|nr:Hsp20/alpha crystallin family protein [Pseudomonadota bacterium]
MTTTTKKFQLPAEFQQIMIGFKDIFDEAYYSHHSSERKYPPCNVIYNPEDNEYILEMAVAGFKKSDIQIRLDCDNILIIKGEKKKHKDNRNYVHNGLSSRNFEKRFNIGPKHEVSEATCEDGVLIINIKLVPGKEDKLINIK